MSDSAINGDSWEQRLQARKVRFLGNFNKQLEQLRTLISGLDEGNEALGRVEEARRIFHRALGAGGLYELATFCQSCMDAEDCCKGLIARGKTLSSEDIDRLNAHLRAVSEAHSRCLDSVKSIDILG